MEIAYLLLWILLMWLLPMLLASKLAARKNRSIRGWILGALLTGWLAPIILFCLGRRDKPVVY